MPEAKIYKSQNNINISMHPGDPQGSPDDCLPCFIFIDDGFLAKLSKYFGGGKYLKFDRISFSNNLAKKENLICKKIFYYTAPPFQSNKPTIEEKAKKDKYNKFVAKMRQREVVVQEGRCQKIKVNEEQARYCQKAVDILLAMDLMSVPVKYPEIKKIILIASDSDFVPVVEQLKDLGIEIILYTYYVKKRNTGLSRSNYLLKSVSRYAKITKQDFDNSPLL
ncbi:NYN domain-containing protein [Candidatus Pacearchaeota archaeon]|nr:NYN domain-containing protein [Candidatus Pacearchaeota archaeon]